MEHIEGVSNAVVLVVVDLAHIPQIDEALGTGDAGQAGPYSLEGLGDEFIIDCVEFDLIDDMLQVQDGDAFRCARELARFEAILAGGSSGAALWGVRQVIERLDRPARIVTIFPDSGARYLSTIYSDAWMKANGFLQDKG